MSELEDRLNAVLSDPEQLQRLTQMATQLMGNLAPSGESAGAASEAPVPAPAGVSGDGALPAMIAQVMQHMQSGKPSPLLSAMGPYLNEVRRAKLERSLRIASAARLAGNTFRGMGGFHGL